MTLRAKKKLTGKLNNPIERVYPELEDLSITPTSFAQEYKSQDYYGYNNVIVNPITSEEIMITPTLEEQTKEGMFHKVIVERIVGDEITIDPSQQEQVKKGLFETVTVNPIVGKTLNIIPSENSQLFQDIYETVSVNAINTEEIEVALDFSNADVINIEPDTGKYFKKVTVDKDANLVSENIKAGTTVFGVTGNVADTTDADAGENDILLGKSAYVNNTKVRGMFQPLDTSDATATASDIALGKTAYVNDEKIEGTLEAKDYFEDTWSSGSITTIIKGLPPFTVKGIKIMSSTFNGWTSLVDVPALDLSGVTHINYTFKECISLKEMPVWNTSNVMYFNDTFSGCTALTTMPIWDTSNVVDMSYMFTNCPSLSNESLNNILTMCINSKQSSNKTLRYLGLSSTQATVCTTLSNYQAFLDAGWTTGY